MRIGENGKTYPVGEKEICKVFGIDRVPASGAGWRHKSDGTKGTDRIEIKETDKESLSVKKLWLKKITSEATKTGRDPRLLIRIQEEVWVAMPAKEYFDEFETS